MATALEPVTAAGPPEQAQASQWRLMWWAFRRHRLAVAGGVVVLLLYLVALFAEALAPFDPDAAEARHVYHPPQAIRLVATLPDGSWTLRPHVQAMKLERDRLTLETTFRPDPGRTVALGFWVEGTPYRLWGLVPMERRLFGPLDPTERFYLLGADRLGRDMLSRILFGTRVSMSIGLLGVALSLALGILLGGLSGYYGGHIDFWVQRLVEFKLTLPTIPIWLGLTAALPQDWSPLTRYFAITLILSLIGWTELARVVRGRFLALRTEDFVTAARLDGCRERRVIFRHMLPSMASHIIASVTLAIPLMILAETSLSFLGLGLLPPTISWGVLLKEAQNVRSIVQAPWLFAPGAAVCLAVLALNFLGDGLRDAADPYAQEGR
jgi:peptide/nickel transport system permease protein